MFAHPGAGIFLSWTSPGTVHRRIHALRRDPEADTRQGRAMTAETMAHALGCAYRSGSWWRCRCPVHHGNSATLALRDGKGGLQVRCFAGCPASAVLTELRRRGLL